MEGIKIQLNNNEIKILGGFIEENIESNYYNKEIRKILEKLKSEEIKENNDTNKGWKEFLQIAADIYFYEDKIETNNINKLTKMEERRLINGILISLELDKTKKKFFEKIKGESFNKYDEFENLIDEYSENIVKISKKISSVLS